MEAGGDVCADTAEGAPGGCDDGIDEDYQEDPAAIVADTTLRSDGAVRYRIEVASGGWTTFRSSHGSYVIGNVHDGWAFDQVPGQNIQDAAGYRYGEMGGGLNACGWLLVNQRGNDGTSVPARDCAFSDPDADPTRRPTRTRFLSSVSCAKCGGGTPRIIRPTIFPDARTDRPARNQVPVCLNLNRPLLAGAPYPTACRNPVRNRITRSSTDTYHPATTDPNQNAYIGHKVDWRYVTKGRKKWVMVKDNELPSSRRGEGLWVFIPRWVLGDKPLCEHPTSTNDPDNHPYRCVGLG